MSGLLTALGVPVRDGRAAADPATGRTSNARVWAIGDIVNGGAEVVDAVQAGKLAARSIVRRPRPRRRRGSSRSARPPPTVPGVDLFTRHGRHPQPQPVLAGQLPHQQQRRDGRRGRSTPAGAARSGRPSAIRSATSPPAWARSTTAAQRHRRHQQHRAHQRPPDRRQHRRDPRGQAALPEPRGRDQPHGRGEAARPGTRSSPSATTPAPTAIELNFGCPHGMSERGMGAAVGQVPDYVQMITEWVMEKAEFPVLVKLTPNVTDIRFPARAAKAANADGVALINTITSLVGVEPRHLGAAARTSAARAPTAGMPVPRSSRSRSTWSRRSPRIPRSGSRSPASAASRPGATPWTSCSSARPPSRWARASCTTASGSIDDLVDGLSDLPARQGPPLTVRAGGQGPADAHRLGEPGPGVPAARADRPGDVHPLQPVLHGVQRRRPPGDPLRGHQRDVAPGRWRTTTAWAAACASTSAR